jgi:hypothetical protein
VTGAFLSVPFPSAGANNGMPSEFVMQKLRATVSAGNQQQHQPMQSGAMVSSPRPQPPQQQMVQLGGASNNLISNEDLQALGINFEMGTFEFDLLLNGTI